MATDKLHKHSIIRVEKPDHSDQHTAHLVTDTKGQAMLVIYQLLDNTELLPGDTLIIDIDITIKHEHT